MKTTSRPSAGYHLTMSSYDPSKILMREHIHRSPANSSKYSFSISRHDSYRVGYCIIFSSQLIYKVSNDKTAFSKIFGESIIFDHPDYKKINKL